MLKIYNTLSRQVEPFKPISEGKVGVYLCGPTVYDYAHLGHMRSSVVYDVLVRHLREAGYEVTFVRNVTDIDDKILKRAAETSEHPSELAERIFKSYVEDYRRIGNLDPDLQPRVSEHIDEILKLVSRLIERDHAYVSEGDVYFRVRSYADYGKLSHRRLDEMELGASGRVSDAESERKEDPADFALWKSTPVGAPCSFESPYGHGRPGWHIECSAMSMHHLGETFDIHGGGLDLVFPHHENEVAQSECGTGQPFARCWMHNGFLEVNKEKMSKSLGNFFTAREMFERIHPEGVRYFMMTTTYRGPLNLDWQVDDQGEIVSFPALEDAERRVEYMYGTRKRLLQIADSQIVDGDDEPDSEIAQFADRLREKLDDDLNLPMALAVHAEMLRAINEACDQTISKKKKISRAVWSAAVSAMDHAAELLGLGAGDSTDVLNGIRDRKARQLGIDFEQVEKLIEDRRMARVERDFVTADRCRDELKSLGVELLDSPTGTTWRIP